MKPENYEYLKNQVKNAGFGEALDNDLKAKMESNEPTFQLVHPQQFGSDKVEATLNFRRADQNDTYYFNKYEVAIVQPEGSKLPAPKQTFYVGKDNNYSLDEGYNLLSHRFVNKDLVNATGEAYNSWVKLNFKETESNGNFKMQHFGEKWGFDLQKALDKYPLIKELSNEADRNNLVASFKKGNAAEVTLIQNGEEKKGTVVVNAYSRSVNVADENNVRVRIAAKEGTEKSQKEDQNESQGQKNDTEGSQKNDNKRNRRQGQGVS
ncbi:hypothetical protein HQ865_11160 [Mucilaginibacter mali]|uniref:Uncharacterized protein n=1 Tax=Mucilaginibacter mali TaxID=2740462 RepID=A0A7D4TXD9_9SPHI|nr:hypothetical protein [Mucilaginibacter mali]QKJ30297.1 hypothetical protein HQ865_11160 [Mucilaginibacter mali]